MYYATCLLTVPALRQGDYNFEHNFYWIKNSRLAWAINKTLIHDEEGLEMEPGVECLKLKGHVFLGIGCSQLVAASPLGLKSISQWLLIARSYREVTRNSSYHCKTKWSGMERDSRLTAWGSHPPVLSPVGIGRLLKLLTSYIFFHEWHLIPPCATGHSCLEKKKKHLWVDIRCRHKVGGIG